MFRMALRDTLISNIKRYMERDAISSTNDLARRSGVPQPTLHRFLAGDHDSINLRHIERIAACFGTDPARLFTPETKNFARRHVFVLTRVIRLLIIEPSRPGGSNANSTPHRPAGPQRQQTADD